MYMHYTVYLNKDRQLKKLIATHGAFELKPRKKVYLHLCASIMSQQLSTTVADIIYQRFVHLYPKPAPTIAQILDTPFEQLRGIGLSNAKAQYVLNVCSYFNEHRLTDARLHRMSNEEVLQCLTPIKGVGQWTVEMLLMFTLGREDVFAADDLGIQQAMIKLYNLDASDKKQLKQDMLRISGKWSPYRTYACLHLWRHKDGK